MTPSSDTSDGASVPDQTAAADKPAATKRGPNTLTLGPRAARAPEPDAPAPDALTPEPSTSDTPKAETVDVETVIPTPTSYVSPGEPPEVDGVKPAKATKKSRSAPRTTARLAAVQALYEIEVSGANVHEVVPDMVGRGFANLLDEAHIKVARPDEKLFEKLVLGSFEDRAILDQLIVDSLQQPGHFERLELILRAILRLGAYELLSMSDVPAKVVISEYMDIGDAFFGGKELSLINAILDRIGHKIREGDFETEGRAPKGDEG